MPGENWYSLLQPASFGGLRFKVRAAETTGGQRFATEVQTGRGTRPIRTAVDVDGHRFDAFLVGPTAIEQARAIIARCKQGQGTLIHPHFGAVEALPVRWSYRFQAGEIEFCTVNLEFQASTTEANSELVDTGGPSTADDARAAVIQSAGNFVQDGAAADELREYAIPLDLDAESDDFVTDAVSALLAQPGGSFAGLPRLLRDLGAAIDAAAEGTLEVDAAERIAADLLLEAAATDELGLMDIRQDFALYLRELGEAATGRTVDGDGRLLPAVAVAEGAEYDRLAPRNRRAVANWFARGSVRL